jgi:hypothetical protein
VLVENGMPIPEDDRNFSSEIAGYFQSEREKRRRE